MTTLVIIGLVYLFGYLLYFAFVGVALFFGVKLIKAIWECD
jgi:hypothetical protein